MSNKRDDLRAYMDAHGLTQQQTAAKLDVSSATVNQYLQGKYKGDTAALDEKVVRGIAGLSHVPHLCDDGGLDGGIEVRVVEDDEGGVPAELHRGA